MNRVARAPIAADNYFGLAAKPGHLLYVVGGAAYYRQGDRTSHLKLYSLKDRKETTLAETFAVTCCPTTVRRCSWPR